MFADTQSAKQRWLAAAGVGIAMVTVATALFRVPTIVPQGAAPLLRTIQLREATDAHTVLSEEAMMRDLAPLFLPTPHNATLRKLPTREPGKTFLDIEAPKLGIADSGWSFDRTLPSLATIGEKPVEKATPLDYLRATADEVSLVGFGRDPQPITPAPARGAVIEVAQLRDGRVVLGAQPLGPEVRPPTEKVWQPMEFIARVSPAGLVGPLRVNVRSGVDEVDTFFGNYLAQTFRIGERLTPGVYRISVAP